MLVSDFFTIDFLTSKLASELVCVFAVRGQYFSSQRWPFEVLECDTTTQNFESATGACFRKVVLQTIADLASGNVVQKGVAMSTMRSPPKQINTDQRSRYWPTTCQC